MSENVFTKRLPVIIIISIFLIVGIITIIIFSCSTQWKPISQEEFISTTEEAGLETSPYKAGLTQYNEVTAAVSATNNKYTIYYYECSNNSVAINIFDSKKYNQAERATVGNKNTNETTFLNYNNIKYVKGDTFWCLVRADNIVIFVDTKSEYKDEINNILLKWGY